jgi:hypothetical protein
MDEKFPYTGAPNSMRKFLKGLPEKAVPTKVTQEYLVSIGMKSKADRTIMPVLKSVGLLDGSGVPTSAFRDFRDRSRGPSILASLIRKTYTELYSTYDDAHAQSDENLSNFFRAKSKLGQRAIQFQVATFKVLCEFGDFKASGYAASTQGGGLVTTPTTGQAEVYPGISITLQIHLPESKDPAVYDLIFQALAKHLMKAR